MKVFTSLVAAILLVAVSGCGGSSGGSVTPPPVSQDVVETVNATLRAPVTAANVAEPAAIEVINMDKSEISEPTSI